MQFILFNGRLWITLLPPTGSFTVSVTWPNSIWAGGPIRADGSERLGVLLLTTPNLLYAVWFCRIWPLLRHMKTLHRLIRLHNLRMRKWAVKWHVINCEMLKLLQLLGKKRFYNLTFSARMRRIITRLNSVHRKNMLWRVCSGRENSNETAMKVQSPYQRIYCVQLVPQRKQCYIENSGPLMWLTRFQCFVGGTWNLNVLILFSFIVLPAHPTLYRVSLRASQPFDGIDHVFFFFCPS